MRRPSRDINIFSISALDLFASAMGAFILIAVIMFPYYQKNAKIVLDLKEAKAAAAEAQAARGKAVAERDRATAERDRVRAENRRLAAANGKLEAEAKAARERAATAEARARQAERRQPPKDQPTTAGVRSAWLYGNLEFVMYEYPGRRPGTQLVVGIVTSIRGASTAHIGDVALLAIRTGGRLVGDLWGFASRPTCFLNTLPMKFQASFAPDGRSMRVDRQTASLSGGGGRCVLNFEGTKSFVMRQVN